MTTTTAISRSVTRPRPGWLGPAVVILLLIASALAVTVLTRSPQGNTGDLDPENPGTSGARGLAHVLRDHGVRVTVVRGQRELMNATVDGATTVVVTGTGRLSGRTAGATLAHAASAHALVLLDPDPEVVKGMGLPLGSHLARLTNVVSGCRGTGVGQSFRLGQAHRAYTSTTKDSAATTCFSDKAGGGGAMVQLPAAAGRPQLTALGDESLVTNGAILDSDNAAIAVALFGQSDHLLWYVPSVSDIAAADSTSRSIAPQWFQPALALGASAVVFLCLWRGRRLGRLVTEPLPVVVRAVETTESRGRMYRKASDRSRALAVLQQATRRRLASYLGLSATARVSSVAAASAAVSGRDYQEVLDILESAAAPDDRSLLALANNLTALEKEVRTR